ncbi:hypothetical protein H0H81_003304 [Sphagnurus paluster]|uniref:Acetyl-coenzyme A synthetase N-terminal domain-containing protein n=1 Tax=Sphagnurus paluster TaxID=117069 RepID=A0A9P7KK88_9AGAR|nr:hypothetical protein H0H81_003304 [Sphagnurus paluster]
MSNNDAYFAQSRLLWKHTQPQSTYVEILRRSINRKHGLKLENYHDLHKYSVDDYTFWLDLWEALGIVSSVPPDPKRITVPGKFPEIPDWFPGARLNYAENLLWMNSDSVACTASGESGFIKNYTFREMRQRVRSMAAALRVNGLQVGDRVAG